MKLHVLQIYWNYTIVFVISFFQYLCEVSKKQEMNLIQPSFGIIVWMAFVLFLLILLIIALIDLLRSSFAKNDKLMWTIVVVFVVFIGPVLYFLIGRKQILKQ